MPLATQMARFAPGIGTVAENNILADFGLPDPTRWITHFEDFTQGGFLATDWTTTAVGTGTTAITDANGGALLVTTSGASGDSRYAQKIGRNMLMAVGKKAFFKARLSIDNVLTSSMIVGLQLNDTTPKDATDGIYFFKSSANSVDFFARRDATTGSRSATGVATMVNATMMEFGWAYDGIDTVYYSIDGVVRGGLNVAGTTPALPDALLSLSFGVETNAVATRAMTVDYLFAAMER
jgi:hypothetical protein